MAEMAGLYSDITLTDSLTMFFAGYNDKIENYILGKFF